MNCPDCGSPMVLRETSKFKYGNGQNRKFYGCSRYPECKATHGAHLGIPAGKQTKQARIKAHDVLDIFWKKGQISRERLYQVMSERTGINPFHIGSLNEEQCEMVIKICQTLTVN